MTKAKWNVTIDLYAEQAKIIEYLAELFDCPRDAVVTYLVRMGLGHWIARHKLDVKGDGASNGLSRPNAPPDQPDQSVQR